MNNSRFVQHLTQLQYSNEQINKICAIFTEEVVLNRNDLFLKEGTISKQLGFVLEGMIRYYYITEDGNEVTRWVSLQNEFITSFSSFITQTKALENIQAIKPSHILFTTKEQWMKLYNEEPFVRDFWTRSIEYYLIGMEARVYSLIALNAKSRYEQLLKDYPLLVSEVPNKYLASILGIESRHLSRLRATTK